MSELIQKSPEWHQMRRTKIGSSDAPVIMGVSPWLTPMQLWEKKMLLRKESPTTFHMERGNELEPIARMHFALETGLSVEPDVVFHADNDWMMASLDGIDVERKNVVEIKCPGEEDHQRAIDGIVPEKYYPQIQHILEVTQLDMIYYYSVFAEYDKSSKKWIIKDTKVIEVSRDSKYLKTLLEEEKDFYKCMTDFIPPKLTKRDYEEKSDDMWNATASEWVSLQKTLAQYKDKEKELRESLISMAQGRNSQGAGVSVCKVVRAGNVEYSEIPELKNINLDLYRKEPIECWRITKAKAI